MRPSGGKSSRPAARMPVATGATGPAADDRGPPSTSNAASSSSPTSSCGRRRNSLGDTPTLGAVAASRSARGPTPAARATVSSSGSSRPGCGSRSSSVRRPRSRWPPRCGQAQDRQSHADECRACGCRRGAHRIRERGGVAATRQTPIINRSPSSAEAPRHGRRRRPGPGSRYAAVARRKCRSRTAAVQPRRHR
jgi:hypothetical protein